MTKRYLKTLAGDMTDRPPFWYMRQAGRYLPEYLETRKEAGSFMDLCYNPELAVEVTHQPIRRYHMDAAILFSDILVIPHALGQKVWFEAGHGPRLGELKQENLSSQLTMDRLHDTLDPVYKTVNGLATSLPEDVALIGFAGAPWTVATYMAEGQGSKDQKAAKLWAYQNETGFSDLIDMITEATAEYLIRQVDNGAEALQIFDTWAGSLSETELEKWVIEPTARLVNLVREKHPNIPIMGFPKGIGEKLPTYATATNVTGVSLDTGMSVKWAAKNIPDQFVLQGNLDPLLVVAGGDAMLEEATAILHAMNERPFIFNLGHGFVPETPPENVQILSDLIVNWQRPSA